jgi:hypothetical protein
MNIETNPNFDYCQQNGSEFPKITITFLHWKKYSWNAYQLPNGVKVMSARQMGLLVGQPKHIVKEFVKSNNLETITVQVLNGTITEVYPQSVAAFYLQKLLDNGNLDMHEKSFTRNEWKELIKALYNPIAGKAITPNPCFFTGDYRVEIAKSLQIQLENNIKLEVLVLQSGEYRIEHGEGLKCIKSNPCWLTQHSPVKAKIFSRLNLSPDNVECRVKTESGVKSLYALSFQDWLSVWEYFANKGNRKATAVLKACARENIPSRVGKLLTQN